MHETCCWTIFPPTSKSRPTYGGFFDKRARSHGYPPLLILVLILPHSPVVISEPINCHAEKCKRCANNNMAVCNADIWQCTCMHTCIKLRLCAHLLMRFKFRAKYTNREQADFFHNLNFKVCNR